MYDGHTIDCDVHYMPERQGEIEAYLEPRWREFVLSDGERMTTPLAGGAITVTEQPEGVARPDALPESGAPAGSDYELMREQLLDPYTIDIAVLNQGSGPRVVNMDLAAELSIARNRWLLERWLEGKHDDRLYGALMIPSYNIVKAAEEIRRTGSDARWCCAMFPHAAGRHLGDAMYEPIWEALAEVDLPMYIHGSIGELMAMSGPYQAGGTALHYRLEMFTMLSQAVSNHITSMIVHGVFERFPRLKIVIAEAGISWLPWYVTSLDANYELMRHESRWVRRRPSEVIRERLRLTTQPCEAVASDKHRLVTNLSVVEGIEGILCFSSDYPHWDADAPDYIDTIFPKSWHDRLFYENARGALRLPSSIPMTPPRLAAPV